MPDFDVEPKTNTGLLDKKSKPIDINVLGDSSSDPALENAENLTVRVEPANNDTGYSRNQPSLTPQIISPTMTDPLTEGTPEITPTINPEKTVTANLTANNLLGVVNLKNTKPDNFLSSGNYGQPAPLNKSQSGRRPYKLIFLVIILLLSLVGLFIVLRANMGSQKTGLNIAQSPDLTGTSSSIGLNGSDKFSVNVTLEANNSIIISPTDQPENLVKGQLFFDKNINKLVYYDGTQLNILGSNTGVTINGQGGDIGFGSGLDFFGNTLSNSGVLSLQGQSGALSLASGTGIAVNGLTITNSGVVAINGTANQISASSSAGNITLSLPQDIGLSSTPSFSGLNLGSPLSVASGGTGQNSLTLNGVIVGNGSGGLQATSAGTAGDCLVSNGTSAPSFQSCSGGVGGGVTSLDGLSGVLTLDNSSGSGSNITIDSAAADNTTKGIAAFNSTNFSDNGSGVINTIQDINSSADPTFAGLQLNLNTGTSSSGIQFGSTADTNLYRSAAATLKTDNSLLIGNVLTVQGTAAIQGSNGLTIGVAGTTAGLLNLANGTNSNLGTLQIATLGQATTYTLPNPGQATASICLSTGNCTAIGSAGGDLTGSYPNPTIAKLQGTTLTISSLASGDVLQYNGSDIVNGHITNNNLTTGTFSNITGVGTLTGGLNIASGQTYKINNVDINTAGALNNVAYLNGTGPQTFTGNNKFTGTLLFQNASDSTTVLQVQNAAGSAVFAVDTSTKQIVLGATGTTTGTIAFEGSIGASGTLTFTGPANPSNNTLTLPNETGTLCSTGSVCTGYAPSSGGTYLAKNAADTSTAAITSSNNLYVFTNSSSAVASGVLKLDNGTNTNSTLTVTASGNPTAGQALIFASDTNASPSGNLIDLQSGSSPTSKFSVDVSGNIVAGGNINTTGGVIQTGSTTRLDNSGNLSNIGVISLTGSFRYNYTASGTITANDVVVISSSANSTVASSTAARDPKVLGVAAASKTNGQTIAVAVGGSISVTADTAAVAAGDHLVTSSTTGQVTADNNATTGVLGIALTSKAGGSSGSVTVLITANGGESTPIFRPQSDSTTAFQIQNSAGNSNLFVADSTNTRIGIGKVPTTTLDVSGTILGTDVNVGNGNFKFSVATSGAILQVMTIGTGGVATADPVVMDPTTGRLIDTTTARDPKIFGIAVGGAANGATTAVAVGGIATINVDAGAVTQGDQLVTSTTLGKATVDNSATTGIIGIAVTSKAGGSAGTVKVEVHPYGGQSTPVFRPTSDSTTAFQLQNSGGTSYLTADSTNGRFTFGTSTSLSTTIKAASGNILNLTPAGGLVTDSAYLVANVRAQFGYDGTNTQVLLSDAGSSKPIDFSSTSGSTLFKFTDAGGTPGDILTIASGGAATFKNKADSTTALQVQNTAGNQIFAVDTTGTQVVLGKASTITGKILFNGSGSANGLTLQGPTTPSTNTLTLPNETGTLCSTGSICTGYAPSTGGTGYIQLQASSPGSQQTGHFNVSGTGIAGTSLLTPMLDTASAGTLSVGTSTATSVTIGSTGSTGTITLGQSTQGETLNIANGTVATGKTNAISIGTSATGTGKDVITIGSTNDGSSITLQAGSVGTTLKSTSTTAFQVQDSGGAGNLFVANTTNGIIGIGKTPDNTLGATFDVLGQIRSSLGADGSAGAGGGSFFASGYNGAAAQYVGNWNSSGLWGIGQFSSSSDNTVRLGNVNGNATAGTTGVWSGTQNINLVIGGSLTVGDGIAGATLTADITGTTTAHGVCHSGAAGAAANVSFVACSGTAGADYAELYPSQPSVEAGDVVMPTQSYATSKDGKYQVPVLAKTTNAYEPNQIGIVSEIDPNSDESNLTGHNVNASDHPMPVALNGRVMTKVNTENGAIQPGDYITASSTPGVGMKATAAGEVVGRALQIYNGSGTGQILIFVSPFYFNGPSSGSFVQNGGNATLSSLTVGGNADFANLNTSGTATIDNLIVTGQATFQGNISVDGHIITANTSGTTSAEVNPNAGQGAACSVLGNDTSGQIILTTGGSEWSDGVQCSLAFAHSFGLPPHSVITPANSTDASTVKPYVDSATDSFTINFVLADTGHRVYKFNYFNPQ